MRCVVYKGFPTMASYLPAWWMTWCKESSCNGDTNRAKETQRYVVHRLSGQNALNPARFLAESAFFLLLTQLYPVAYRDYHLELYGGSRFYAIQMDLEIQHKAQSVAISQKSHAKFCLCRKIDSKMRKHRWISIHFYR